MDAAVIVIFGITGDLSQRYLLPSLYNLIRDNLLPAQTRILGISRRDVTTKEVLKGVKQNVENCEPAVLETIRQHTSMFKMDLEDSAAYEALLQELNKLEEQVGLCLNRLYYLSIPPKAYDTVVRLLGEKGLNTSCQHNKAETRLMVEKPFGHDLASAQKLISETGRHFMEDQVYRIDHYMAKPAVKDLLAARLHSEQLEAVWNSEYVAGIEIAAKETIGIEGRTAFYDSVGALRDFVQSHLVQILGIAIMDRPEEPDSDHLHLAKELGLEQIEPPSKARVKKQAVRGQYKGYKQEVNNPESITETYAAVTFYSASPRWQGVPLTVLNGKRLDERITKITASLKKPLPTGESELSWSSIGGNTYEKVLLDAISGDRTLFASGREILASWRILQPVLDVWQQSGEGLVTYESGSAGPEMLSDKL